MDLRNPAMARLTFLVLWTTAFGFFSGFVMGLFVLVYRDGYRKGVLPPHPDASVPTLREAFPTVAKLASRIGDNDR